MVRCLVPSCKNTSEIRGWKKRIDTGEMRKKVSFHSFPKDPAIRNLWIDILKLDAASIPAAARICSDHFKEKDYEKGTLIARLSRNALPIAIQEHEGEKLSVNNTFIHSPTGMYDTSNLEIKTNISDNMSNVEENLNLEISLASISPTTSVNILSSTDSSIAIPSTSTKEKATMTCHDIIYNSPEKCRLRKKIELLKKNYKRRIRNLQQNVRRKTKQITTIKDMLNQLKKTNLLNVEQADTLQSFSESSNIFNRIMHAKRVPRQYDEQFRVFALTLHYYSPRAYEYVRSKFNFCLPHPKTITKWYGSIHGEPGIISEALNYIRQRVNNVNYPLLGSIIFDEMAIKQHVEFDGTKFCGYTDMGDNIISEDNSLASEALVIMIVCINEAWKIPIAYFLINKISSEMKSNLILQCISAINNTGMKVISVTCDGLSSNISAFKYLGCNFDDIISLQTSFQHPDIGEIIVAFLDPCHMLKLIRNVIGDIKIIIDGNGEQIKWSDLETLHAFQQSEDMHLGNKLRKSHIDYHNQKMKVRLAAQIFSTSVANSLLFCKDNLQLKEFQSCQETIKFLRIFNDLFDIFNSKNIKQHGFKQPLNEQNAELIVNKLKEIKDYILSLKTINGQLLIHTRKKTGFLDFLICINSAIVLYNEMCKKKKLLKYIPFYKISQDHVELFFGCIRHHGGHNNNPTTRQFKAAIKKIIVHTELRNERNGNCISLEQISILHASSANKISKSEDIINMTSRLSRLIDDATITTNEDRNQFHAFVDHNYVIDIREISEFAENVIEYIAGYVVKQLKKKLHCEECLHVLTDTDDHNNNLISVKNRQGALIQPSKDVIIICNKCERIIRHAIQVSTNGFITKKFYETYLTNDVLKSFLDTNLFHSLREHTFDQSPLENHVVHLIRAIAQNYIKIRLHYITLNSIDKSKSKRHLFNKIVLFKGM